MRVAVDSEQATSPRVPDIMVVMGDKRKRQGIGFGRFVVGLAAVTVPLLLILGLGAWWAASRYFGDPWWTKGGDNAGAIFAALAAGLFTVLVGVSGAYFAAMKATEMAVEKQREIGDDRIQFDLSMAQGQLVAAGRITIAQETQRIAADITGHVQRAGIRSAPGASSDFAVVNPDSLAAIAVQLRYLAGLWNQLPGLPALTKTSDSAPANPAKDPYETARWAIRRSASALEDETRRMRERRSDLLFSERQTVEQLVGIWADTFNASLQLPVDKRQAMTLFFDLYLPGVIVGHYEDVNWTEIDTFANRNDVREHLSHDPGFMFASPRRLHQVMGLLGNLCEWLPSLADWQIQCAVGDLRGSAWGHGVSISAPVFQLEAWLATLRSFEESPSTGTGASDPSASASTPIP